MRVRGIDEAREQSRIDGAARGDKPRRGASSYPEPAGATERGQKGAPASRADEPRGARPESAAASAPAARAADAVQAADAARAKAVPRSLGAGSPGAPPEAASGLSREGLAARLTLHLRSLGIPADGPGLGAARALMAEYLPMDLPRLRAVVQAMKKAEAAGRSAEEAARLAARALAAGLDPDDWPPEAVEPVNDGADRSSDSGGHGQAAGGEGRGTGGRREDNGRRAEADADRGAAAELLRASAALALSDGRMRAFAAPNAAGLGWLYAPFNLGPAGFEFRGTMRILYNYRTGRGERLVLETDGKGGTFTISLAGSGDALRAEAHGLRDPEAKVLRGLGVRAVTGAKPDTDGAYGAPDA